MEYINKVINLIKRKTKSSIKNFSSLINSENTKLK